VYAQVRGVRYHVNYRHGRAKIPLRDFAAGGSICAVIYASPFTLFRPGEKVIVFVSSIGHSQTLILAPRLSSNLNNDQTQYPRTDNLVNFYAYRFPSRHIYSSFSLFIARMDVSPVAS